jgi:hypothetical protein
VAKSSTDRDDRTSRTGHRSTLGIEDDTILSWEPERAGVHPENAPAMTSRAAETHIGSRDIRRIILADVWKGESAS